MDGALVAFGVQSHASHKVGAGLRSLLNQSGADRGPGDGRKVHWSVVVNCYHYCPRDATVPSTLCHLANCPLLGDYGSGGAVG
jgi:hypothetical protein